MLYQWHMEQEGWYQYEKSEKAIAYKLIYPFSLKDIINLLGFICILLLHHFITHLLYL